MIKQCFLSLSLFVACAANTQAQYYYKDLVSNRQAIAEKALLTAQKIRLIQVHSFEGNRLPSEGFFCEKKISKDFKRVETYTRSYTTGKSMLTTIYNNQGQVMLTTDSSDLIVSSSSYTYHADGTVASIVSNAHSKDDDFTTALKEEHQYIYNNEKQPVQMRLLKNNKESMLIDFILDAQGNVTDEISTGPNAQHYYYYYDTKKRLTDIVKFNVVLAKLMPDFSFEYNNSNQLTQMIAVEEGVNRNYYTWKYVYNDGLRIIEKCFSKENDLLGYFEYEYK